MRISVTKDSRQDPRRGEVWVASLDPARGAEMRKTRPVVVVSSNAAGALPVRIAAPCTTSRLGEAVWRLPIQATDFNGLDRDTTIDLMQLRAMSTDRFVHRLGRLTDDQMEDVAAAIAILVGYA